MCCGSVVVNISPNTRFYARAFKFVFILTYLEEEEEEEEEEEGKEEKVRLNVC